MKHRLPALGTEVTIGPNMGKPKTYKGMLIPTINARAPAKAIMIRLLNMRNPKPMTNPNNPVVNGKINNSAGCKSRSKNVVNT